MSAVETWIHPQDMRLQETLSSTSDGATYTVHVRHTPATTHENPDPLHIAGDLRGRKSLINVTRSSPPQACQELSVGFGFTTGG